MALNIGCEERGYLAEALTAKVWFYQNGITRFVIGEPGNTRFQISQEGISIEWDKLHPVKDLDKKVIREGSHISVAGLTREDGAEKFEYIIELNPFKVIQKSNNIVTQVINPEASLYFEDMVQPGDLPLGTDPDDNECFAGLR